MRKIKPKKKDVEKKRKKVYQIMEEMFRYHSVEHNEQKTLELAKEIEDLRPDDPIPAEKVASIRIDLNRTEDADRAVTYLEETFPPTAYRLFLRSRVCDLKKDYGGCIEYSEKALLRDDLDMLTRMMIYNILGHAYRYAGDAPNSLKYYELSAKIDLSTTTDPNVLQHVTKIQREDYSNYLFSLHNVNVTREKIYEEICGFNTLYEVADKFTHDPETHPRHEKLRIGYVSPDIRRHVVAFFSYAFFKCYDKSRFEVYIYAKNKEDNFSAEFKRGVDGFRNILFDNPKDAAQKIMDDEIDILVDLSGHTANNCMQVMAYKPAPVQISAIGWFNTTGVKTIDYFMVDKYTDPEGLNEDFFSEKLLRLQHSHFCYMWHDDPTVVTPAPCTKNGFITFVSFNNFTKVTDETLRVWAKIVNAVPGAKLYLKGKAFRDQYGTDHALARIEAAGLPIEKLIYEEDEQRYLQKYAKADIALDTFPYPGGGTTCDALYMGLPVVTYISSDRHNSRFGYSLLMNMGLGELCAFTEEDYIKIAVDLANDWDRVRDYHLTIRRRMEESPIMDDTIYMGEVEAAYEKIFNAWINGEELPDFPQDPPPVTNEQAEEYYNRALGYIDLEENFDEGNISNIINVKRALYNLELAATGWANTIANLQPAANNHYLIAACRKLLSDYVGAYVASRNCERIIAMVGTDKFSREFLAQYHELRGELAVYNCNPIEGVNNYDAASKASDELEDKCRNFSAALNALNYTNVANEGTLQNNSKFQDIVKDIEPYTEYHERGEKIKVGLISPNFRAHTTFPSVFGYIAAHNKEKFELTCYSLNKSDDNYTNIFKSRAENFVDLKDFTSFAEIAEKIHDDKIDVLIDLAGHSERSGLPVLAYRPAPVQISGIGALATTGMETVDYFITDENLDPVGESEEFFTEKLLYLPSHICYAQREDVPKPEFAPCTKRDYVTFGTMCSYKAMNDDILRVWKEIFNHVENYVCVMKAEEFRSKTTVDQIYTRMKNMGFDMDKILFLPITPNYMADMLQLDLILDAYPYVNGTLNLDAIYMGVPVVSFYGERHSTRLGMSALKTVGIGDLAVTNAQHYMGRAIGLANDKSTLDALHKNLRTMLQRSAALNPQVYARALENKIEEILK